jgi:hypothetical protein
MAPADVLSESHEKLQLRRLLLQYGLEDEAHVLASNGIKKDRDLLFIDEDVIKDLELSPVSKAKLRRLVKAVAALETVVEDSAPAGGVDVYDVCVRIEEETATEKVKAKLVRLISASHAEDLDGCERSERSVDYSQMLKSSEYEYGYEEGPANKAAPIQLILPTLYAFFSKLYAIYGLNSSDEKRIMSEVGVSFFAVKIYLAALRQYSYSKVEHVLMLIHEYNLRVVGINDADNTDADLLKELVVKIMDVPEKQPA